MEEIQNTSQLIIGGDLVAPPSGIHLTNFLRPCIPSFLARRRRKIPVTELIIHETLTTSVETTIKMLQSRKLGVHFIIGSDRRVT